MEKALAAYHRQQFDDSELAVRTLLGDELVKVTLRRLIETSERALAEDVPVPANRRERRVKHHCDRREAKR